MAEIKSPASPDGDFDMAPPPAAKKPKKASLYSQAGSALQQESMAGLGAEGASQPIMAQKALQGVMSNLQVLSTILPGIMPLTSDLMGRIQMAVPSLLSDVQSGGMGMVPVGGIPAPQPGGGMPPPPMPMGAGGDPALMAPPGPEGPVPPPIG
jgi:hypothetical protein